MSPLRVISVVSNQDGVGKTTLANNLAVFLRALRERLPILVLGLDDHDLLERMFALDTPGAAMPTVRDALLARDLRPAIRPGQHGVHYVPPSPTLSQLGSELQGDFSLRELLVDSGWSGLVVVDTGSDLGAFTRNALAASDLALIVVADRSSLDRAEQIYALLDGWGRPQERARIVLSRVDRRVRYDPGEDADVLASLLAEIRRRGYPCFESFLSRSPEIESLRAEGGGDAHSILHGAPGSLIHRQLTHLANDVLRLLETPAEDRRDQPRRPFRRQIACFAEGDAPIIALRARDLSTTGIAVEPSPELARARRVHLMLDSTGVGASLLVWARLIRSDVERMALRLEPAADAALGLRLAHFVAGLDAERTGVSVPGGSR